nr:hypothetical protein [Tanacetum cinerariifolium]
KRRRAPDCHRHPRPRYRPPLGNHRHPLDQGQRRAAARAGPEAGHQGCGRPGPALPGDQRRAASQGPEERRRSLRRAAVPARLQGRRKIGHLHRRKERDPDRA